ncbi:MAG: glycosyltransferase [Acidimicrobiia bacterium]|nr:glycosyltransferase [Acidimicrobiia bacterium]
MTPSPLSHGAETAVSESWTAGDDPSVSVVISTFNRAGYLRELVTALEAVIAPAGGFEVVIVDNGSGDATWSTLVELVETRLALAVVRVATNRGPGGGRNVGLSLARGQFVAFTDDDCLPTPGWLEGVVARFADVAVDVVQGRVSPHPAQEAVMGPWDHTVAVGGPTPFFETSNVAYRRRALQRVGGFDEDDPLTARHAGGRAFGEDAVLGWRVVQTGGARAWADDAVVHHRCVPSTYLDLLRSYRWLEGMPGLAGRSGVVRESLYRRVFLNHQTAKVDLALLAVSAAVVLRRPWPLAATAPWVRMRWPEAVHRVRRRRRAPAYLAARFVIEAYGASAFLRGSIRHRRIVL